MCSNLRHDATCHHTLGSVRHDVVQLPVSGRLAAVRTTLAFFLSLSRNLSSDLVGALLEEMHTQLGSLYL